MNTNKIKTYAPKARRDFIAAVTRRAGTFGLTAKGTAPVREEGQLVFIEGQPYPRSVGAQRQKLATRVKQHGFEQTMEAAAYTWFNRLIAIRFMELHGYLDHSFRVLSHPAGLVLPEILGHAEHLDLPGLDRELVITLKMDGNRDEELYRDLLLAQCRALHRAMPFLFERVDDETELLLPDNLLQTDSLIRDLVSAIPEEDWQEVEIIGWLYQFYISEKKDQVIGKVVKSEDIPAATQLFTPNWIVQYLVQNSVGRLWLMANPASTLKGEWPYYIEPAEQTPEVQAQLDALIALRCREEVDSGGEAASPPSDYPLSTIHYPLNPETITVLDPACGSGHILVVAYDVLKAIYLERGYRPRDIPRLILEKNLYGLDIDDRAAQLAGFALLMKARADDRRLFDDPPRLNVLALQESKGLDARDLVDSGKWLVDSGRGAERTTPLSTLLDTFAEAKTFGSLIQIPPALAAALPELKSGLLRAMNSDDVFARAAAESLLPLLRQAWVLAMQFDAVIANPPYMGTRGMPSSLKDFSRATLSYGEGDLFALFMERWFKNCAQSGFLSMVTMQSWMFLSTYEKLRNEVVARRAIQSLLHIGYNSFPEMNSKIAQACAFSIGASEMPYAKGIYCDLNNGVSQSADKGMLFQTGGDVRYVVMQSDFKSIPGWPLAYWVSVRIRETFSVGTQLGKLSEARRGLSTGNNEIFIRYWFEVSLENIALSSVANKALFKIKRWFPYNKGGAFRRWYGNNELVVNWQNNGFFIKNQPAKENGDKGWRATSSEYYCDDGITWCGLTSADISFRWSNYGALFDTNKGPMMFPGTEARVTLAFLSSKLLQIYAALLNPTLSIQNCDIDALPVLWKKIDQSRVNRIVDQCIDLAKKDWDCGEISWAFPGVTWLPLTLGRHGRLRDAWLVWKEESRTRSVRMKALEEENNRLFISAYGLEGEISPDVSDDQITLVCADREKDCQRLISYAIGCMMGRYRLDRPGLIYAHSGNRDFEAVYNAAREESTDDTDDTDEHRSRNEHLCPSVSSVSSVDNNSFPARDGIFSVAREESTDDTDEHRSGNEHLCPSVSSVDNNSFPARDGIFSVAREESTDDTDGHRSRNEHLCPSVSSVDNNPFPADADGIIPITESNWFDDDAPNRIREFLLAVWGAETLNENMAWLAESLGSKSGETPDETIRRYLSASFFKDHLQTYKRRPIYWCFSSGKQKAFEALVYLHRYHEGTLARMRMEYVVPLQGKMAARIDRLIDDIASASTTAQAKRLQKERDKLTRQLDELRRYDEQLRHYADQRIALDLDDGVKVNYAKFGDLLAEVKAVTGTTAE